MDPAGALRRWGREPRWARRVLVAVLLLGAGASAWNLGRTGDLDFYAAGARSMSASWRAFALGAFDPASTVTLDKLSGFLVPQALAARLLGFSDSALSLPQVLEGVVAGYCCATLALRLHGRVAGLSAAAAAASTPVLVSMFGRPMEDGMLTAALAVAALLVQRATLTGRLPPVVLAGLAVGVGFQAKMLVAWVVLPALAAALLAAHGARRTGALRVALLLGAALVASLAWMTVFQALPAASRPVVDGTTDDGVFTMVFGYNGIDRLVPHAIAGTPSQVARLVHVLGLQDAVPAQRAPDKLLLPYYLTQIGWLYPTALAGIVLAVRRTRGDRGGRAAVVLLVVWLATAAALLSLAGLPHTAYVAAIAVQLAVLSGVAAAEAVRLQASDRRAARAVLPALLVVEGAWSALLAATQGLPAPLGVLLVLLLVAGVVAAARLLRRGGGAPRAVVPLVVAALLAGPVTWTLQETDPLRAGTGGDAYVGVKPHLASASAPRVQPWRPHPPNPWQGPPVLHGALAEVVRRIGPGATAPAPLLAADSERVAAPLIAATGREVLTDGGYSGAVAVLDAGRLRSLVDAGRLSWLLTDEHPSTRSANAVDRLARSGACRLERSWRPSALDPALYSGLALWRCSP